MSAVTDKELREEERRGFLHFTSTEREGGGRGGERKRGGRGERVENGYNREKEIRETKVEMERENNERKGKKIHRQTDWEKGIRD